MSLEVVYNPLMHKRDDVLMVVNNCLDYHELPFDANMAFVEHDGKETFNVRSVLPENIFRVTYRIYEKGPRFFTAQQENIGLVRQVAQYPLESVLLLDALERAGFLLGCTTAEIHDTTFELERFWLWFGYHVNRSSLKSQYMEKDIDLLANQQRIDWLRNFLTANAQTDESQAANSQAPFYERAVLLLR